MRNEEKNLAEALKSVCSLNYPNYKILVVNDRSTDSSGSILNNLQKNDPKINIINIDVLPEGWLGKNHALFTGYNFSTSEFMLFTDADVIFSADVLTRAMNYTTKNNLDHLTILPDIITNSSFFKAILSTFIMILTAFQRPWGARDKKSKASMGVGAFNLVKRSAYVKAGTHRAFAMRPDDDLKLGLHLKKSGSTSDVLFGNNKLQVEWYANLKEFIDGLMKNTFSGFNYNPWLVAVAVIGMVMGYILPIPILLIFGNRVDIVLALAILYAQIILYWKMQGADSKWWFGLTSIYGSAIVVYILIRSAVKTLLKGGIIWRGTFYPLKELRRKKTSPLL